LGKNTKIPQPSPAKKKRTVPNARSNPMVRIQQLYSYYNQESIHSLLLQLTTKQAVCNSDCPRRGSSDDDAFDSAPRTSGNEAESLATHMLTL